MFSKSDIEKYFNAEKSESLLFLIAGIIAVLLSVIFFFFMKNNISFFKGAAAPLLLIGLIQGIVGYTVYKRSDEDRKRNVYAYDMSPAQLKDPEIPRMETVMKNFVIYRWVEIIFIIAGLILIFMFRANPDKSFWYGLGLTLAIQAAIMLSLDFFAEKRGHIYLKGIREFTAGK
jgi:drug/metabolite transporter (DMT)-like permease